MALTKGVWGIDIGQCALKALRLELVDGVPTATAFDYVEHTKILSQPDADPDMLIREALEKFLLRNTVKNDDVAVGIAGQSGLARFVKLPPVEEKKIAEIVKFEAKQQIPFPLDEVVWDFQKIAGGEAVDGFALETEIGLFAMKRDVISRYLGYFNTSKIEVHTVQMSPLALVNFATYELLKKGGPAPADGTGEEEAADDAPKGKKRCAVVMDIGTDASNLIITDGAKIIWQRPIPLGGNNFTRALTKELKLTFAKAEHLKRNAAKSPEMASILKAIKPVLTDFVGEVQRSLGYFTNTHRDAHVAYMVGLGSAFKLPGLQNYLKEKLSLDVRKPGKFARLGGETTLADPLFQENLLTFPVAYGLALQGLGQARLSTNLLPPEIRMDRVIRAKKPYAVAAAAALLLGTGGLALGYASNYSSLSDPKIKTAMEKAKGAVSSYTSQESKFNDKVKAVQTTQEDVKLIIAGQEQRLNWPRLMEVVTAALPRPGTGPEANLDRAIWVGEGNVGVEAYEWWKRRMRDGVPVGMAAQDAESKHPGNLAIVNVEAVNARWVDNIGKFLEAADNKVVADYGNNIATDMKDEEREIDEAKGGRYKPKMAEGAGWVVEIRGFTDHKAGPGFIKKSLLKNLQNFDKFAKDEKKISRFIVGVDDPVKGKVSHAFLYNYWRVTDAEPNSFVYITESTLDKLMGGGSSGAGGQPGGRDYSSSQSSSSDPSGGGGQGADASATLGPPWTPLAGASSAGAFGGKGGSSLPPAGSGGTSLAPITLKGVTPIVPGVIGAGKAGSKDGDGLRPQRFEFVVMFFWREPAETVTANTDGGAAPNR